MIRKHLSIQMTLVMLTIAGIPLVGTGLLTHYILEQSIIQQVHANQHQIGEVSAALVKDYIQDAQTKLKSIAQMIGKDENPQEQAKRLNSLLDPPDIFLEIGYWTIAADPQVKAQVQQSEYNLAQSANTFHNRNYNPSLKQYVINPADNKPMFTEPAAGNDWTAPALETLGTLTCLPISVPAPEGAVLTANLDFRPIKRLLAPAASNRFVRLVDLSRATPQVLAEAKISLDSTLFKDGPPEYSFIESAVAVGHAHWWITVQDFKAHALAPLREARFQLFLWFGLACVLAIVLAELLGRRILIPIQTLAATAGQLGRGDLAARSGIVRDDEIGHLARTFDRMAAAVQELDRMKDDFVAHVSHELRTPLTSAKMALANVQEGLAGKESLGRVQEDLDRLIRMVNELLDAARLEAGIPLEKHPTDLGALARSSVETLRPLARVPLEVSGSGATVDLDPARVQQILVNLVDNAIKYARSRVQVSVQGREVRVTDDGPGVPPEMRERIFQKFARTGSGPKPPGAGLGLSIARKLAELHGGSLTCEGNTFVLRL